MVLTEEQQTDPYPVATLENATLNQEKLYYNIPDDAGTRVNKNTVAGYPNDTETSPNDYIHKLNGNGTKVGTSMVLKVMSGDKVNIRAKSWYRLNGATPGSPVSPLSDLVAGGLVQTAGVKSTASELIGSGSLSPGMTDMLNTQSYSSTKPKAYVNWVLFDEQFKYVGGGSGFDQVGADQELKQHLLSNLPVTKNGYLYIYVSNETPNVDVFFDNVQVTHIRGALLEETHYYPFGGTLAGISSKAAGKLSNKYKFGGKELQSAEFSDGSGLEWYDYGFRMQDPQLGRWNHIDPLADLYLSTSPYGYVLNNPIKLIDPDGRFSTHTDVQGNVIAVFEDGDLGVYKHENNANGKAPTEANIRKRHKDGTSAGGEKVGETWTELGFADFGEYQKNGARNDGSVKVATGAKIDFGSTWAGDQVSKILGANPDPASYALMAKSGGDWDVKAHSPNGSSAYGSLLYGKYASARDAGNMAAGAVAQLSILPNAVFDYGYGAYNQSGNSVVGTVGIIARDLIGLTNGTGDTKNNPKNSIRNTIQNGEDKLSKRGIEAGKRLIHLLRQKK